MAEDMKDRIMNLLNQKNMSQKQLAEKANVTESAISHYLKGDRVPRSVVVERIADALGTSVDYLLRGDDELVANDKEQAFRLIARSASHMSYEEKQKIMDLLFKPEESKK